MNTDTTPLRLLRLDIHDFKRVTAVEIDTDGKTVVLSGNNAQGKSSVLDSLEDALRSKVSVSDPVRHGAKSSSAEFTIGNDDGVAVKIKRVHHADGRKPTLEVRDGNDNRLHPPRKVIDNLLGQFPDVMAFATPAGAKTEAAANKLRRDSLLQIANLPIDLDEMEAKRSGLYADRTSVQREARSARAALASMHHVADPGEEWSVDDLLAEQTTARVEASRHGNAVAERKRLGDLIGGLADQVSALEADLVTARAKLSEAEERLVKADEWLAANDAPDVDAITAKISEASEHNRAVADAVATNKRRSEESARAVKLEADAEALTAGIEAIDAEVRAALDAADIPGGLTVDADGVYLPGPSGEPVPFASASTAQKIEASVAVAAASNPRLRTLVVRSANDLDPATLARVLKTAADAGYQLLVERVAQDVEGCVVISDGTLAAVPAASPAPAATDLFGKAG